MHAMHFLVFASYSTVAETSDVVLSVLESDSSPYFQGLGLGFESFLRTRTRMQRTRSQTRALRAQTQTQRTIYGL